jgi:methyl-accepting chemotaxis protein
MTDLVNMKILNLFTKKKEIDDIVQDALKLKDLTQVFFVQSENLKKLVETVRESVDKSSTASVEISEMVAVTAASAQDLEQTAKASTEAMENSKMHRQRSSQFMDTVTGSIQELHQVVESGLEEIGSILNTMFMIQEKSKMINEIVFQTKLLSFNASVEAARAGEYGRGFAVVAEEMGKLARQSGAAAHEIEAIILEGVKKTQDQIQTVGEKLAQAVQFVQNAMEEVNESRAKVSMSLEEVASSTELTKEKSQQISVATQEQAIGVSEINKALHNLEEITHKLEKMAQDNHTASISINELTERINQKLEGISGHSIKPHDTQSSQFDFDGAIKAHIDWKMKLSKYLSNPDGSLDGKVVCLDNQCALGKWLYSKGHEYKPHFPEDYESLRSSHAEFHQVAGKIVDAINQNRPDEAKQLLGPSGPYMKVSDRTVDLIRRLKTQVENLTKGSKAS